MAKPNELTKYDFKNEHWYDKSQMKNEKNESNKNENH